MPGCCGTWYVPTIPKYAAAPTNIKNPSQMMKTFWSAEAIISSWLNWLEIEMDGWQDEWMRERNIHNERLNHIKWDTCQNALINRIPLSVCFFLEKDDKTHNNVFKNQHWTTQENPMNNGKQHFGMANTHAHKYTHEKRSPFKTLFVLFFPQLSPLVAMSLAPHASMLLKEILIRSMVLFTCWLCM